MINLTFIVLYLKQWILFQYWNARRFRNINLHKYKQVKILLDTLQFTQVILRGTKIMTTYGHNKGYRSQLLNMQPSLWLYDPCLKVQTVNGNELHLFLAKEFPPTHNNKVAHLTLKQRVQLLTYLAMTQFGPRIEPITSRRLMDALRVTLQFLQCENILNDIKWLTFKHVIV